MGSSPKGRSTLARLERWCWLPILPLAAVFVLFLALNADGGREDPLLILILNEVLIGGLSILIAYLGARAYLATGEVAVLLLGAGMLVLGAAATAACISVGDPDAAVTVWTLGACLAGTFHLGAAATGAWRNPSPQRSGSRPWSLVAAYVPAMAIVAAIAVGCALGLLPSLAQSDGATPPSGQFVLGAAVAQFLSAGITFFALSTRRGRAALRWYATALVIIAIGLAEDGLAASGVPLDWAGHSSQYLGVAFVLAAVVRTGRLSRAWGSSTEEALRGSEERLRIATRAARAGTWEWYLDSDRTVWSPELCDLFGVDPARQTGRGILDIVYPGDRGRLDELLRVSARRRTGLECEFRIVRQDDRRVRWMHSAATLLVAPVGEPSRMVGFTMDITERKAIERQMVARNRIAEIYLGPFDEEVFDRVLEAIQDTLESPVGLVGYIDAAGSFVVPSFSAGSSERCDVKAETMVFPPERWGGAWGRALREGRSVVVAGGAHVPVGHVPIDCALCAPIMHQDRPIGMYQVGNRPGGYGPEEVSLLEGLARQAAPVLEARLRQRQEERERLEAARSLAASEDRLRTLNAELEDRVLERTAMVRHQAEQLRELTTELTRAEQRERQRLARLLHDHLQQTLSAARLHLGIVTARVADQDSADAAVQVDELLAQSIEESRSLAVQLSPPVLQEGGLAAGLHWLARDMRERHGLRVEVDAAPGADVPDEDTRVLLYQSARELLFNVVKHAGVTEARVTLRRDGPLALLAVEDRGCGFNPATLRSAGATSGGFGLFSIQQRVEVMGGEFSAVGTAGCVQVSISIPSGLLQEEAPAAGEPAVAAAVGLLRGVSGGKIRVLLADDHTIMRQGLAILLEAERDLEVVGEAQDGEEAVSLAKRLQPDIVVMDVSMPKLNGVEATRRIRADCPGVAVIGLSMFDEAAIELALREAGACAYLTKGGPSDDLVRTIRDAATRECEEPPA